MMRSVNRRSVAAWLAMAAVCGTDRARASEATLRTFDECLRDVRSAPYEKARKDVAWDVLRRKYRPRADAAAPGDELNAVLNEMLGEIGASHTAVLAPEIYEGMMHELSGESTPTFGALLEEMRPGHLFVRALYEHGPAEHAGLKLGDQIVAVDGENPFDSDEVVDAGYDPLPGSTRLCVFRPSEPGDQLELRVRSSAAARARPLLVTCARTSGLDAGRKGMRVVERGRTRIGVIHLWLVARGAARFVHDAIRGKLADCDALVVDLRGRGGLSDEIDGILAPFRAGQSVKGRHIARGTPVWKKPVVFLIDDRTRSAKEIAAWNIRHDRLGPLVGEPTEGSVLGAGFFALPGGSYLEVGMMEVPVGDGSSLEGVGVEPSDFVAHVAPFSNGVDPILEKGLALAAKARTAGVGRRGPF